MVNTRQLLANAMILLMIGATTLGILTPSDDLLREPVNPQNTESRQSGEELIGAACEGLTFEDMFVYSYARFSVDINADYASAQFLLLRISTTVCPIKCASIWTT